MLCFPLYNNVYPKYCQSYEKDVNEIKDFIFANYYKRIGFSKENSYYSMKRLKKKKKKKKDLLLITNKLIEKIPDLCDAKEHYQSFIRKKNTNSIKQ